MKHRRPSPSRAAAGVTLIELLCVMCILVILASLLLPAVARAYGRARGFAEEFEAEEVAALLLKESRDYCAANAQFQFTSKADFADKCHLWPKCRSWIEARATQFVPFNYLTPTNQLVLQVYLGPRHRTVYPPSTSPTIAGEVYLGPRHRTVYSFTSGDLSIRPEER